MGLGDVLSQYFFGEKDCKMNWLRTAHIFTFGFVVSGPGRCQCSDLTTCSVSYMVQIYGPCHPGTGYYASPEKDGN